MIGIDPRDDLRCPPRLRDHLAGSRDRIVVTGAGGWLGRATLAMLDDALGPALPGRVTAFAASDRSLRLPSGSVIGLRGLANLSRLPAAADGASVIVLHYAFLTREWAGRMPLADYVATNRAITAAVAAACRRLPAAGVFTTSSGAARDPDGAPAEDPIQALAANPYGVLKREEERAFEALGTERGIATAICRVFNLGGPYLNKPYALGDFVRAALAGTPIRVAAAQPVLRSYAHVGDVVAAGLAVALGLLPGPTAPYDTAGDEVVEVGTLAARVRAVLGPPNLAIERPAFDAGAAPDRYVGDGRTFADLLAFVGMPRTGLDAQIAATARDLACVA